MYLSWVFFFCCVQIGLGILLPLIFRLLIQLSGISLFGSGSPRLTPMWSWAVSRLKFVVYSFKLSLFRVVFGWFSSDLDWVVNFQYQIIFNTLSLREGCWVQSENYVARTSHSLKLHDRSNLAKFPGPEDSLFCSVLSGQVERQTLIAVTLGSNPCRHGCLCSFLYLLRWCSTLACN